MSGFQGLLGRLNGKTDGELNKEEETRRNVYLRMYTGQKYGFLNFVSGGFLVGDTISREKSKTGGQKSMWLDSIDEPSKLVSNSRKRKHEAEGGSAAVDIEKHAKRAKKRRGHVPDEEVKNHDQPVDNGGMTQKVKSPSEKAKARAERRALKDAKRARKEERRRKRTEKEARKEERRQRRLRKQAHKDIKMTEEEELESDTPLSNIAPTQVASSKVPSHGRQALRKRYILQKKMASLDSRALKEVSRYPYLTCNFTLTAYRSLWKNNKPTVCLDSIALGGLAICSLHVLEIYRRG